MKQTTKCLVLIAILCVSCTGSKSTTYEKLPVSTTQADQVASSAPDIVINQAELVDQTIPEQAVEDANYGNGDGTIIERKEHAGKIEVQRKFVQTFSARDYTGSKERNLYLKPDRETIVYTFTKDTEEKFVSSRLLVTKDADGKNAETWIQVRSSADHEGWLFIGRQDPFEDDNWILIGTITVGEKTLHLRKYSHWFSTTRGELAYDRPSLESSTVVWKAEPTADNDQINLAPLAITEETFPGKNWNEHWVKVKDSYGRIGWFPGDRLSVERGGFMYLSPLNIVNYAFTDW